MAFACHGEWSKKVNWIWSASGHHKTLHYSTVSALVASAPKCPVNRAVLR